MKYYQDITLLPEPDIELNFLWCKVFTQMHIALVECKNGNGQSDIGFSWPNYHFGKAGVGLGNKLRVFAQTEAQLEKLNVASWLSRLSDYAHISSVKAVPEQVEYVSFARKSVKGEKRIAKDMLAKAELWSEKSGDSVEKCLQALEATKPTSVNRLPYIVLESQQTKAHAQKKAQPFKLFIEKINKPEAVVGAYSCYGLSKTATVPWF